MTERSVLCIATSYAGWLLYVTLGGAVDISFSLALPDAALARNPRNKAGLGDKKPQSDSVSWSGVG